MLNLLKLVLSFVHPLMDIFMEYAFLKVTVIPALIPVHYGPQVAQESDMQLL